MSDNEGITSGVNDIGKSLDEIIRCFCRIPNVWRGSIRQNSRNRNTNGLQVRGAELLGLSPRDYEGCVGKQTKISNSRLLY